MKQSKRCPECESSSIYTAIISAGGGYAPDLLPGAHPWWRGGKLEIYVCTACGFFQQFVPADSLDDVRESGKFRLHS